MWRRPTPSHRSPKRFARNASWTACDKAAHGRGTADMAFQMSTRHTSSITNSFFAFQGGGRLTSVVRAGLWRLNRPMPSTVDHADIRGLVPPDLLRLGACSLFQRGLIPCGTTTSGARAPARLSNLHSATRCAVMSMNCAGTAGPPRAARTVLRRVAARVASTDPGPGGPGWGGISRLRGHALGFRGRLA